MSASEFAFLALGLVLGVASGAALIEVLRARPPMSRHVRLTVAPNAIQSRRAATLADPNGALEAGGPARGGPADRRWHDEIAAMGEPAATGRRVEGQGRRAGPGLRIAADVRPGADSRAGSGTPVRSAAPAASGTSLVAVPMSIEPDPITTALRASAAASARTAVAAVARATDGEPMDRASATPIEAVRRTRPSAVATEERAEPVAERGASLPARAEALGDDAGPTSSGATAAGSRPGAALTGPCAEERRVADERCAVAGRAREGAAAAAAAQRLAQRTHDEHVARAEAGATQSDPRAVRAAKEQAQQRFRNARTAARTRDDVETGAREWLSEINRINHETREAVVGVERDRAAAAALGSDVERLAVEADATRISAERADEACLAAREAVAVCDEARTLEEAAARSGATPDDDAVAAGDAGEASEGRIAAATPEPEDEFAFSTPMRSQAGEDALILRILRGDREAMQRAVARLAGDDPDARRRWQAQLGGLAEALIARSIEASAFEFPIDHPFWGPFTQSQNRDIAAGLSSLGFRFDGFGGWVDERLPSQRDLSLAVGYAGLDPMRVRRWPTEAEMRVLFSEVRVAADEYIAGAAGGLTLGELVTLLGRRADGLTELWNAWGSVRPILLEAG